MPLLQTLTPGEDSQNNRVTIKAVDELGQPATPPDLTQYDDIKMEFRDSKKTLLAEYKQSSNSTTTQPYKLRVDQADTNVLIFDVYGEDTTDAVPGMAYVNVNLILSSVVDYPNDYNIITNHIVVTKFTKAN